MKKILGVLFVAFMLVGCSGGEKTTTICKGDISGLDADVSIDAKGDEVTAMVQSFTIDVSKSELSDGEILDVMKGEYAGYDGIEGVTLDHDVKDGIYTAKITVDMTKANFDDLAKLDILDDGDIDYISLKETISEQETAGLTCKEK